MRVQALPRKGKVPERPSPPLPGLLGGAMLLAALGCGGLGDSSSGDHAGQLNGKFKITPPTATVIPGQTLRFSAQSPWGSGATWAVQPASGGTIDADGNFTASASLGQYLIVAMWKDDVRYTATATAAVLPPGPPATLDPGRVQASGRPQTSANGAIQNAPLAGEFLPTVRSANATGTVLVRHGFEPPTPR